MKHKPMRVFLSWVFASSFAATICIWAAQSPPDDRLDLNSAPITIIGTSLSVNAFPPRSNALPGVLGDGRSHTRSAVPAATSAEIEKLLGFAVDDRVETIILEARPFIYFGKPAAGFGGRAQQIIETSYWMRSNLRIRLRRALGFDDTVFGGRSIFLDREPDWDQSYGSQDWQSKLRPVNFVDHQPSPRLVQLVNRARKEGTQIVLFLPPRSPMAAKFIGAAQSAEIQIRARTLAHTLGLPLFDPRGEWTEGDFSDPTHLSLQGRAKLLVELRNWWATQS